MGILDDAKEIAELVKKYNDRDLYQKILDLRTEILELREENLELKADLKTTKEAFEIKAKLVRVNNCYYFEEDAAENKQERPFCLTCWDADRRLISLIWGRENTIKCGVCAARQK